MKTWHCNPLRASARTLALGLVVVPAVASAALLAGPGAAATVGATLTPPPPDWYTCRGTGSGTVCHGSMSFQHLAGVDGSCPQGFDILENGHDNETGARYYDRDGNLVRRVLHDNYPVGDPLNVLYNSVTGTSIAYRTDLTESDSFAVPGDFGSITSRFTGNLYSVTTPGGGALVHDSGMLTFSSEGDVLVDHGPKMLFDGDTAALCAALADGT
ncbi:hypothetical protein [Nocardioides cynanchi]|uniref:hypothetical protein n=1 Tax=Nocardioides cynanchi TaxID=2558918 RepID=UPI001246AC92|nr:hypothetical protein [Nocardioides cynanchi]